MMITPFGFQVCFLVLLVNLPIAPSAFAQVTQTIAHRGSSIDRPECTIASLQRAIEVGVTASEVDVRTSKDGHLMILHDATVDRTTDGSGEISELTFAELRKLDAGSWFDKKFSDQKIPTLKESLILSKEKIDLLLDLKESGEVYDQKVAKEVMQFGQPEKVIIGIRSVAQAKRFRALLPKCKQIAFIPGPDDIEAFAESGVETIRLWPRWIEKDPGLIARVKKTKRLLHCNGATGKLDEVKELLKNEPNSLSSDDPAELLKSLNELQPK